MDEEKPVQPIIVVRKKGHEGHHGGAWKVAYADFVTAMMAFFLVMWLVGQSPAVKEAVAAYFTDPAGFMEMKGKGKGLLQGGPKPPLPSSQPADKKSELDILRKAADNIKQGMQGNPDLTGLRDQVEMAITSRGLRIQLTDKEGEEHTFFEIGSAKLQPGARKILGIIAKELSRLPNSIAIEGHTDSRQYPTPEYTNWELSADRANAARFVLEENGVLHNQIQGVEGYADRFPKYLQDSYDPRNRRIAILVLIKADGKGYYEYESGEPIH